ncbi:MAG: flagellar motor switch protein FliN [Candidatus Poribacteria bacterium]|nr:flagellar motor switch protein FliN [Candidatus Poribacteria bacterium]
MAGTDKGDLEALLASSEALSDDDLDLDEGDLSELLENAEQATQAAVDTGDDLELMEDFSLEEGDTALDEPQIQPHNLELLMDVELDVVIELGRTRKTIRDVLHFGPGSVIELNKMAGETVDVFINDRLIAKGEVILFEDSLGVRITSIVTTGELIKNLGK